MLRNVVECIFGVLKRCFRILLLPAEYNIAVQVQIPPALCLVHNVICTHDPDDISDFPFNLDDTGDTIREVGLLASSIPTDEARIHSHQLREDIAAAMWSDYNMEHIYRGLDPIDE